jgi:galactose mutarotase-like enzyme
MRNVRERTGKGREMEERPILFSTSMVQAILDGRKTMTRRVLKNQPLDIIPMNEPDKWITLDTKEPEPHGHIAACRFGKVGDRLWVREMWAYATDFGNSTDHVFYKASYKNGGIYDDVTMWKPSIFMPRRIARITLEITNVRVDKLVTLNYNDAIKEGFESIEQFKCLWDKINSKKENCLWQDNPYVWILEFRRV